MSSVWNSRCPLSNAMDRFLLPLSSCACDFAQPADVDERHQDALDDIVATEIWQDPHQIKCLAILPAHPALDRLAAIEHGPHVAAQVAVLEIAHDVGRWAALIAGNQIEYRGDGGREGPDHQVLVEEDRGDTRAREDVAQVGIGVIELL